MADTAHRSTGAEGMGGVDGVAGGVGLTALLVAAARAIETHRPDSLAQDVYAEHFVLSAPASAHWPVRLHQAPDGDASPLWGRFARYFGLRTRVLDDFVLRSVRAGGARQVVLLGAGLDTRAFRLDWPPDCVIFEIDRGRCPRVQARGAGCAVGGTGDDARTGRRRSARRLGRRADGSRLRPGGAHRVAGRGLLFYLPNAAETYLISTVDRLSAAGSALAFEVKLEKDLMEYRDSPLYRSTHQELGIDLLHLFSREPRPDSAPI